MSRVHKRQSAALRAEAPLTDGGDKVVELVNLLLTPPERPIIFEDVNVRDCGSTMPYPPAEGGVHLFVLVHGF
jgi:hypothetical protein